MTRQLFVLYFILLFSSIKAREGDSSKFEVSGFAEFYYGYDFGEPRDNERPFFLVNHKRHNEFNLNLAYIKSCYNDARTRATFALMTGGYAQYNLSNEPTIFRFINEANMGIRLSEKKSIWLDVGIMPSHIGFESAVSADCWTLSRSVLAENSPYYETGARLTIRNKNNNLFFSALLLNGWQNIQRINGLNNAPSLGFQLNYRPKPNWILNLSTYNGPNDILGRQRTYINIYTVYETQNGWGAILGFDYGTQEVNYNYRKEWASPVLILKKRFSGKHQLVVRGEYFNDNENTLYPEIGFRGWNIGGVSINWDYTLFKNTLFRIEMKEYTSTKNLFEIGVFGGDTRKTNFALLTSLSKRF